MPYPSTAIANEFLARAFTSRRELTQMKLQKLVYIAHGWNLAVNGEPLVSDAVEAWEYGPVLPHLYQHARNFGNKPITRLICEGDDNAAIFFSTGPSPRGAPFKANLRPEEKAVIDRVWARYGDMSAFQLSDLTHQEGTPWFLTFFQKGRNGQIDNELIKQHYVELARAA
jgi:uncharacterized phage-associated protein